MIPRIALISLLLVAGSHAALAQRAQNAGLKIVVVSGEDAVNIIQQKTAVSPIVEVRDRNNVPVAGALVTFTIDGGGKVAAFAGTGPTFTVATNAAGQAAASAINPIANGAFHIQVQAAFQGQTAAATIAQTNVVTAAQAAGAAGGASGSGAGGSGGGGAGTGAGAGGAGGGVSGTTIGVIAGVAGAGAVAGVAVAKNGDEGGGGSQSTVTGSLSGTMLNTISNDNGTGCVNTRAITGTMTIDYTVDGSSIRGKFKITGTDTVVATTCPSQGSTTAGFDRGGDISGTPGAITYHQVQVGQPQTLNGITATTTTTMDFNGALNGKEISGTYVETQASVIQGSVATSRGNGTVTMPVTLR